MKFKKMKPHPLAIELDELVASGTLAVSQASPVVVDIDLADNDALFLVKAGEGLLTALAEAPKNRHVALMYRMHGEHVDCPICDFLSSRH